MLVREEGVGQRGGCWSEDKGIDRHNTFNESSYTEAQLPSTMTIGGNSCE